MLLRRDIYRFFLVGLAGLWVTAGAQCLTAQTATPKVRAVPGAMAAKPFSIESPDDTSMPRKASDAAVRFLPAERMAAGDKLLEADAEASIAEHAARLGYDLSAKDWSYQQIVCPAFPGHLFLQYMRRVSARDVTEFSASIPRGGEGRVRIIPILKRSYSLFAPAPVNAITVAAFNHIRAEEASQATARWLGNALCYAALAGAHPMVSGANGEQGVDSSHPALTAQLDVPAHGGEQIEFFDDASATHPMQWTLIFNRKGQVVKATRKRADAMESKPVPERSAVSKTWTAPTASAQ
ncbi:MAG: hypothetical protein KGL64_09805 [Acidobacteriota bacterium]|nr:hypothetical protein [Acidobacteriota bacterium]